MPCHDGGCLTYICEGDLSTEALVTRTESLVEVKRWSRCQFLAHDLHLLLNLDKQLPNFRVVVHGFDAERCMAWRWAELQALTAELPGEVLIHGHERRSELTILEQTIDFSIHPVEQQVAVLDTCWYVQFLEGLVKFPWIQITFAIGV